MNQAEKTERGDFSPGAESPAALYGLPQDVEFCTRCVISNQRPSSSVEFKNRADSPKSTIHFDEEGVCDACRFVEHKQNEIDWESRENELRDLCDRFRRTDGAYDCVVPGSGGKDSVYAAHVLKYKYGMHPLTVTWAPHIYTDWGWKNFQAWLHSGFDNQLFTPNGRVHRLLTRLALDKLLHPFQSFVLGQKNIAPKVAARYGIPLIFYGENEAEYGNPIADNSSAKRDWSYFSAQDESDLYLSGTSIEELVGKYGIDRSDLQPYMPADPADIERNAIEVHYLGYYLKWHPQSCYYYAVEHCGFEAAPERTSGTYSKYNSIDDKVDDLHYYTTYIKFGIGRATYDAAQEIRSGDITREEGAALVRRFDGEYPERFFDELMNYLSISEEDFPVAQKMFEQPIIDREYFDALCDSYRSPHLWARDNNGWRLRRTVWHENEA
jgi:N-acetyl sugar amidotransferase